ncbi:MAG: hypothetical protein SFZ03_03930 [Candidatus Melainabacteria bacterium]|nr:hypothetical protein [Candidatus Melainabacteria bacterium]
MQFKASALALHPPVWPSQTSQSPRSLASRNAQDLFSTGLEASSAQVFHPSTAPHSVISFGRQQPNISYPRLILLSLLAGLNLPMWGFIFQQWKASEHSSVIAAEPKSTDKANNSPPPPVKPLPDIPAFASAVLPTPTVAPSPAIAPPPAADPWLDQPAGTQELLNTMKQYILQSGGFMIGDTHGQAQIPGFIRDHVRDFKAMGVRVFYIEMVQSSRHERLQQMLAQGTTPAAIVREILCPPLGVTWCDTPGDSQGFVNAIAETILAFHQEGIRVVGIDHNSPGSGENANPRRLALSNPHWLEQVQADRQRHGVQPFLLYGGRAHSGESIEGDAAVVGVDRLLTIPSFDFEPSAEGAPNGGYQLTSPINPQHATYSVRF